MNYSYWLLRYVPDTVRGEFVNVGVIVGADRGDWAIRRIESFARASRLGGDARLSQAWLGRIDRFVESSSAFGSDIFLDDERISSGWLRRQSQRLNNSVQISQPTPIVAQDAATAADLLYERLVLEVGRDGRAAGKARLVQDVRIQYEREARLHLGVNLRQRASAEVGRQHGVFDFVVGADDALQVTQAWAFDVKDLDRLDQEVRSWSYLVGRIRDEGGRIVADKKESRISYIAPNVPIWAIYKSPSTSAQKDRLATAQEAWSKLQVNAVSSSEIRQVARQAEILVGAN